MFEKVTVAVDNFKAYDMWFLVGLKEAINEAKELPFYVSFEIHDRDGNDHNVVNLNFIPKK